MAIIKLGKKALAIIIIASVIVALGGAFGIIYAITHRQFDVPVMRDIKVIAEPDYTITLEWEKVSGALSYTVEYKYSLYPDEINSLSVSSTSCVIKMVKGELQYRIKSTGKYSSNASPFSEWQTYYVEPLKLDTLREFNFIHVEGKGYQIDMNNFYPVEYVYKGERYTINYYEIDTLNEDEIRDELNPNTYSLLELQEGVSYKWPSDSGEWIVYIRPVLYVNINGVKDYTQIEGLYELYDENIEYTEIRQTV